MFHFTATNLKGTFQGTGTRTVWLQSLCVSLSVMPHTSNGNTRLESVESLRNLGEENQNSYPGEVT